MDKSGSRPVLVGVALLLPLLYFANVFFSSLGTSLRTETNYDFVYATCSDSNGSYSVNCREYLNQLYAISRGELVERTVATTSDSDGDGIADIDENYRTRLFIHYISMDESNEVSLANAQGTTLSLMPSSPEGVMVEWVDSSDSGYYLTRGNARQQLNLDSDSGGDYNRDNFRFLGWVLR